LPGKGLCWPHSCPSERLDPLRPHPSLVACAPFSVPQSSWTFYLIGAVIIGIAELAYLFLLVWPGGVITPRIEALAGPLIWLLATLTTPFGLPDIADKVMESIKKVK
jgi:hypothetical protein